MKKTLSIKDAAVCRRALGAKAFALAVLPVAISTHAAQFEFENGSSLAFDNYITYGAQWRVQAPDKKLYKTRQSYSNVKAGQGLATTPDGNTSDIPAGFDNFVETLKASEDEALRLNTDDGNLNFNAGSMTQNKVTWISELDFKGTMGDVEYGAFLRGKAYYDQVYAERSTHMRAEDYWRYNAGKYAKTGDRLLGSTGGHGFPDQFTSTTTCNDPSIGSACMVGPQGYGGTADLGEFAEDTRDELGAKARFLDAFVYTNFELGGQKFALRVGEQVINLGESNFFPGLMGMVNSLNAYDSHQPGVEVKELLLPTGAIDLKWAINSDISLEAYWQYDWNPHYLDPAGSFFSMTDFLGAGNSTMAALIENDYDPAIIDIGDTTGIEDGRTYLMGFIPNGKNIDPNKNGGQWGIGGHYMFEDGSDIGLYHVVYHAKIPSLVINPGDVSTILPEGFATGAGGLNRYQDIYLPKDYSIRYMDEIRTYGASFTTNVGEVNVFGEYTWTANAPVVTANDYTAKFRESATELPVNPENAWKPFNAPKRVPINQVNLGVLHVLGSNILSDQVNVIAETGVVQYQGVDNSDVKYDNHGWGVAMRMEHFYFSVMPGVDISVPFSVQVGLDGTIREQNIIEDAKTVGIGVNLVYLGNFSTGLQYATYFGADDENWVNDRDNVSFTVKYSM